MDINDWIDQTLAVKGYIQAQEDREDFILRTDAVTKFNKWMKKAGLFFNKQTDVGPVTSRAVEVEPSLSLPWFDFSVAFNLVKHC